MTTTANIYHNYIGGKWQDAESGQSFPNYNMATVRDITTGAEIQFPFGDTRGMGNGHHDLDDFTEWKVVYTGYSGKLQKAQIEE